MANLSATPVVGFNQNLQLFTLAALLFKKFSEKHCLAEYPQDNSITQQSSEKTSCIFYSSASVCLEVSSFSKNQWQNVCLGTLGKTWHVSDRVASNVVSQLNA